MKNIKKSILYLLITISVIYILPIMGAIRTGGSSFLIYLTPVIVFIVATCYGLKNGFAAFYPIIIFGVSIPIAFLFFGSINIMQIIITAVIVAIFALAGNLLGAFFYNRATPK